MSPSPAATWVLVCLVRVYERDGRATVRSVADEAGRSLTVTHNHLRALRAQGFVTWDEDRAGTLRPLVAEVAR